MGIKTYDWPDLIQAIKDTLKQGKRCVVKNDKTGNLNCVYNGEDGAHCVVGHMIKNDQHAQHTIDAECLNNGPSAATLVEYEAFYLKEDRQFMNAVYEAQQIHDGYTGDMDVKTWAKQFADILNRRGYDITANELLGE